jgi:long-chain fatty acid transport protein
MGTAFVAVADDPSAIVHNPAGLTALQGTHVYGGGTAAILPTTYESPQGHSEHSHLRVFLPPHLFVSSDFGFEGFAFGLGLYSPFGIGGRTWSQIGLTRYVSTTSQIATFAITPALAWRPLPGLSLGVGLDYLYAVGKATRKIDQSAVGAPDGNLELKQDGGGWGFNLGVLYRLSEQWSLGVAYRSRVDTREHGTIKLTGIAPSLQPLFGGAGFKTTTETTLRFPDDVSFGVAFRPTPRWILALGGEWQGWSRFAKQRLDLATEVPAAGVTDLATDAGWGSTWYAKLGVEHAWSERLSLRAGYAYIINPVPDRSLSPDNPDANQHNLLVGLGYKLGDFVLDVFYNFGLYERRTVTNTILSGTYTTYLHSLGFSIGYQFGGERNGKKPASSPRDSFSIRLGSRGSVEDGR